MESVMLNDFDYERIQGFDDLELIDNVSKRSKKRAEKATKKALKATGKKKARLTKKATRLSTKGTLAGRIVKGAAKVVVQPALLPLIPLKPVMKKALEKKGIKPPSQMLDLVNSFYNNVVKNSNYDNFEDIDLLEMPADSDHAAIALTAVVSAVITFIKGVKKKKSEGGDLTPIEKTVADTTETVETKLEEEAKKEVASEVGSRLLFDKKTQIVIGAVLLIVIVAFVVMFRKVK